MRNRSITSLLISCFAAFMNTDAAAEEWPSQPVRIVVPYAAGGAVDILGRAVAQKLSEKWKQPVIIDNRGGAAEVIGATAVAKSKPDGYTLFMPTDGAMESNAFVFSKLAYNPVADFEPITALIEAPLVYVVRQEDPINTIQQLVAAAKAEPGKISYGSSGVGASIHLAVNWLGEVSGAEFVHVAYKGSAPAIQDLLSGTVRFSTAPLSLVSPFIKSGQLRPIATTGRARMKPLPDVPTLTEVGYRDSVIQVWFGLVAPARKPKEIVNKIAADAATVMRDPKLQEMQVEPFGFNVAVSTPAQFSAYMVANREGQKRRVAAANVKLD